MILIDKYSYTSGLARVSPKSKIYYSMVPLLLCISFNSIAVSLMTIFIMAFTTVKFGKVNLSGYIKLLTIPFSFLAVGTLTILINRFEPEHVLIFGLKLGRYAYGADMVTFIRSMKLILKALGAVSCMYFLSLNTPMSDIFQVLRRTKLPALIVTLMELIYRYIFVLLDEAERMNIAKDSRLGNCNFKTALKSMGELVSMLFVRAYQRSDRIYAALESRGYDGQFATLDEEYTGNTKMNAASMVVCGLLICAWLVEWIFR